jgi:hypothetical protein
MVPLEWHVNHGKLCFMTNMDVEKYKLNHWILNFDLSKRSLKLSNYFVKHY